MVTVRVDPPAPPINTTLGPIATVEDFLGFIEKFEQAPDLTNFIITLPQSDYAMYFEYKKMLQSIEVNPTQADEVKAIKEGILKIMDERRILEVMISMEERKEDDDDDVYDGIEPMNEIELEGEIMQLRRLELPTAKDIHGEENDDYDYYDGVRPMEEYEVEGEIMELLPVVSAN